MDLGPTQKPRVHLGGLSSKQVAFLGVVGLVLVGGIILRNFNTAEEAAVQDEAPVAVSASPPEAAAPDIVAPKVVAPEVAAPKAAAVPAVATAPAPVPETPPATEEAAIPPSAPAEQTGDAAEQPELTGGAAEQAQPDADMILVARTPVELLAGPSADASVMFGFPAGRPFRVIGREAGFVHIQDESSGARGWIDEAALAAAPPRAPIVSKRSRPRKAAAKRRSSFRPAPDTTIADELERAVEPPKRPGLFGRDGLFGGIFGN